MGHENALSDGYRAVSGSVAHGCGVVPYRCAGPRRGDRGRSGSRGVRLDEEFAGARAQIAVHRHDDVDLVLREHLSVPDGNGAPTPQALVLPGLDRLDGSNYVVPPGLVSRLHVGSQDARRLRAHGT